MQVGKLRLKTIFRRIIKGLFAPVTGKNGAIAGSLGIFLGFIPPFSVKIALSFILSILCRLNIAAIFLGMLFSIFIPIFTWIPAGLSHLVEVFCFVFGIYDPFIVNSPQSPVFHLLGSLAAGLIFSLICFPFFRWFFNIGITRMKQKQRFIFLDLSRQRWRMIKRISLVFLIITIFIVAIFFESINANPFFPGLQLGNSVPNPGQDMQSEESLVKKLDVKPDSADKTKSVKEVYGLYVNWDENSKDSLKEHIGSITTLIPEWLQLSPKLAIINSSDRSIMKLADTHHVKIMPLVNNYSGNTWDSDILHKLFADPNKENRVIRNLLKIVKTNGYSGINIDFEQVRHVDKQNLTHFMAMLAAQFHKQGLMVTEDVPADDPNFAYGYLAKSVDRMMVMLYDEHSFSDHPGPIASAGWMTKSLMNMQVPSEKLIVSLGAFGYNWTEHSKQTARSVTFGDIMDLGAGQPINIHWDKTSGNPYLRYQDGNKPHIIWFLDAVSFYNQMKIMQAFQAKGLAIWRLGSEDPSIWKLINNAKGMHNPVPTLKELLTPDAVQYTGKGEILRIASSLQVGKRDIHTNSAGVITNENYLTFPKPFKVVRFGKPKTKQVALTFDDGPSSAYTPKILDILKENHIKASFFIVGENAQMRPDLVERIYKEGHEIGNHTYSHPNVAAVSPFQTKMELNLNQRLFQEVTGHSMTMFRPPYVANAEPSLPEEILPILRAQKMGYTMIGELIDPNDWRNPPSNQIVKNVVNRLSYGNVILLHDAGGDRINTVNALPKLIKELKQRGYTFTTIGQLIGKDNQEIMPPVNSDSSQYFVYDKAVFQSIKGMFNGITLLFYSFILFGMIRLVFFIYLSRRQVRKQKEMAVDSSYQPSVSVVISAYNEEKVISRTIDSILKNHYPVMEVIVVNDGSTDHTPEVIRENFKDNRRVRLISKRNTGKALSINLGVKKAKGEIVVLLDADTLMAPNAISLLVPHFKNKKVAAVSGNVKVGNIRNLLTTWQHIEYVTGFNLERRAFAELNCITVVPGAIGAWRKSLLQRAGYFKTDTLAEDTDITLTLLQQGWQIHFEEKAYGFTEAPEDIKSLVKQRYRWTFGTLQCLWKHRDALFDQNHKALGFVGLPNMWIFQYVYQFLSPIADILFVLALFGDSAKPALIGFGLFYFLDLFTAFYAFRLEKEKPRPLLAVFLQRIIYKQIMTYAVIKSILSAFMGIAVGWSKLKRTGRVTERGITLKK